MTKYKSVLLIIILLTILSTVTYSENILKVNFDGNEIQFDDLTGHPFISENQRAMVPFRHVLETLGIEVAWDNVERHAIGIKDGIQVIAPIGDDFVYRNGLVIENDEVAQIVDGKTYLPIRVVLEAFDYKVSWDNKNWSVMVEPKDGVTKEEEIASNFDNKSVLDYRNLKRVTPSRDQGQNNTCWAFAGIGALEGVASKDALFDFSEDHLVHNTLFKVDYKSGGYRDMVVSYLTSWAGPVLEVEDGYRDGVTNNDAKVIKHVQDVYYIDNSIDDIKEALSNYGPVQASLFVADPASGDTEDKNFNRISSSYYYDKVAQPNHDVVIVGYDDNYKASNFNNMPPKDGAYIVKNSWGPDWGEDGFFYVSYYDKNMGTEATVFAGVDGVNNFKNIYQHDEAGVTSAFGYEQQKLAYMANVFAKGDSEELLQGVSFYTLAKYTSYEVYLISDYTEVDDLKNKREFLTRGELKEKGYHTIDLKVGEPLKAKKFAVVVVLESNTDRPIAIEEETANTLELEVEYGVSFVSPDGNRWIDLQETFNDPTSNGSICIKAFTN